MPLFKALGFLSYAHEDDELLHGAIRAMGKRMAQELTFIRSGSAARPEEVFIDCTSIQWGVNWAAKIDKALAEVVAFVPVLTPRYFQRESCRYELETFLERMKREEGLVVLPILYQEIADFGPANPDSLIAEVSTALYEDWSKLRLKRPAHSRYRRAINRMAARLDKAATAAEPYEELDRLIAGITELRAPLQEAVVELRIAAAQCRATRDAIADMRGRFPMGAGATAQLKQTEQRCFAAAEVQMRCLAEIDRPIKQATRITVRNPDIEKLTARLHELAQQLSDDVPHSVGITRQPNGLANSGENGVVHTVPDDVTRAERLVREARAMIASWRGLPGDATPDAAQQ